MGTMDLRLRPLFHSHLKRPAFLLRDGYPLQRR
jgi:hypothetical protein